MIKGRLETRDGDSVALLGLSGENVTRLVAGEPISINLADMGFPAQRVVIVYGKTEQAILDEIRVLAPEADIQEHTRDRRRR